MNIRILMGCAITPENYAKIQKANVIQYLIPNTPLYLSLHGTEDDMVPLEQSEMLYDVLCEKGVEADYYLLEGAKHSTIELSQLQPQRLIVDFLDKHMK